ncbi:MAG: NADH-quinone oxidoreductase subunit H, partial [Actinomycetia bacterium]|nr:NADH-quinone oxidoreductase subunit H [Actinomycetes bacterium]
MTLFIEAAIKVLVVFVLLLVTVILLVWVERKFVSDLQNRVGPDRAGPYGIMQTLADGMKAILKEGISPANASMGLYLAAPIIALVTALLIFMVIPLGPPVVINGTEYGLAAVDLNVGLLYVLALSSMAVYAITLAGWASGSKYPMLGSVRASAQMISYEAAMGLALIPVVMFAGSTSMTTIVEQQTGTFYGFIPAWNIVLLPSFVIFLIAGFAEANRPPFDLVEAEQELVGGFHTEYSGFRFALFFLAEYMAVFNISALTTTLFLGGWSGPV